MKQDQTLKPTKKPSTMIIQVESEDKARFVRAAQALHPRGQLIPWILETLHSAADLAGIERGTQKKD